MIALFIRGMTFLLQYNSLNGPNGIYSMNSQQYVLGNFQIKPN